MTLNHAGNNQIEIIQLMNHYAKDDPRYQAALFLVSNMSNKYFFEGPYLDTIDQYFDSLMVFRERDGNVKENEKLKNCWTMVSTKAHSIGMQYDSCVFDCERFNALFFIRHIDQVYYEWKHKPAWADTSFSTFLEYVLPYRLGLEKPDTIVGIYKERHRISRDTAQTVRSFMRSFAGHYHNGRNRFSRILETYPYPLNIGQIERGHYGSCKSNAMYCTMVMRSLGIPATRDYVRVWGNKGSGHSWCVLFLRNGGIYPFNPFSRDSIKFDYKPVKVFRTTYSNPSFQQWMNLKMEVPSNLINENAIDVTSQYGKTYDIEVPVLKNPSSRMHKYGVLCVFDPTGWIPVWYGLYKEGVLSFSGLLGDVLLVAAFYEDGKVLPCSEPFILEKDGNIHYVDSSNEKVETMVLKRKYPRFRSTRSHARQLVGAVIEASVTKDFQNPDTLYCQSTVPVDMCDTIITSFKAYRYFRWKDADEHIGNLAEIEFYGIYSNDNEEKLLQGEVFGFPENIESKLHSYQKAVDGDPDTYFEKETKTVGYVGIDLGPKMKAKLTRVRFCPRSDTNYILKDDMYELFYLKGNNWQSAGVQIAKSDSLVFADVPSNTLYWLRDHTKGREERPFTYEQGVQIWW